MNRNFKEWFSTFSPSISDYSYYTDFEKILKNVDSIKVELNILNSLIGSNNISHDFIDLVKKYPDTLKCIPILLAVRSNEIFIKDKDKELIYNFNKPNMNFSDYGIFMEKTGLFSLMEKSKIKDLVDYVTGVETGLDSNSRKNRGGHIMENLVESHISKYCQEHGFEYFKEMRSRDVELKWNIDLGDISNNDKVIKRFDFVIKTNTCAYLIEANFYSSQGSKLNETARSYKNIAIEMKNVEGAEFIWFTDGYGWKSARNNLEETFDNMKHIYNIKDLNSGILDEIIV